MFNPLLAPNVFLSQRQSRFGKQLGIKFCFYRFLMHHFAVNQEHLVHEPFLQKSVHGGRPALYQHALDFAVGQLMKQRIQTGEVVLHQQCLSFVGEKLGFRINALIWVDDHPKGLPS